MKRIYSEFPRSFQFYGLKHEESIVCKNTPTTIISLPLINKWAKNWYIKISVSIKYIIKHSIHSVFLFLSFWRGNNLSSAVRRLANCLVYFWKVFARTKKRWVRVFHYRFWVLRVALESFRFLPLWFLKKKKKIFHPSFNPVLIIFRKKRFKEYDMTLMCAHIQTSNIVNKEVKSSLEYKSPSSKLWYEQ